MLFPQFASISGRSDSDTGARLEHGLIGDRDEMEMDRRDEIMSIPDTEALSFSNISSPRSGHRSPFTESGSGMSGGGGGLGLAVEDLGMSFVPLVPVRRAESVVSLSESEGEGGSEWERISVARST
jgi:hypothetical protein